MMPYLSPDVLSTNPSFSIGSTESSFYEDEITLLLALVSRISMQYMKS